MIMLNINMKCYVFMALPTDTDHYYYCQCSSYILNTIMTFAATESAPLLALQQQVRYPDHPEIDNHQSLGVN